MRKFLATMTIAATAFPAFLTPAAAEALGRVGTPTTIESAAAANGEKTFFKSLGFECEMQSCAGTFKGKTGRLTTIREIQCVMGSDGQAQGGQVFYDGSIVEYLPIISRATDGMLETTMIKTPANFAINGAEKVTIILYSYGVATFGSCIMKGSSTPS